MTCRPARLVFVAALIVVSCSSDPSNDLGLGSSTAVQSTTPTAPNTETPATTTPPPTSSVAPSVAATTVQPTTTVEATTTTDLAALKAQVEADYAAGVEERTRCNFDPAGCNFTLIAVPDSPQDLYNKSVMVQRVDGNLRAVEGHGDYVFVVEGVEIDGSVAYVTACGYDTVIIYDLVDPANPDDDIIFDDSVPSTRVRWEMHVFEGHWLRYSGQDIETKQGGELCGF